MKRLIKRLLIPRGNFDYDDDRWHRQLELEGCGTIRELVRSWIFHKFGFVPASMLRETRETLDDMGRKYEDCKRRFRTMEAAYLSETKPKRKIGDGHITIKLPWPIDELAGTKEMSELVTAQVIHQIIYRG